MPQLQRWHRTIPVAIVGGRPDDDEVVIEHVLVAFLHELMRTANQLQAVEVVELEKDMETYFLGHRLPKETAGSSGIDGPSVDFFRVGPQ